MTNTSIVGNPIVFRNRRSQAGLSIAFGMGAPLAASGAIGQPLNLGFPALVIAAFCSILAIRSLRAGTLKFGPSGLAVISLFRTQKIPTSEITRFDPEIGPVGMYQRTYLVIHRSSDPAITFNSCNWPPPSRRVHLDKGKEAAATLNQALRSWTQRSAMVDDQTPQEPHPRP